MAVYQQTPLSKYSVPGAPEASLGPGSHCHGRHERLAVGLQQVRPLRERQRRDQIMEDEDSANMTGELNALTFQRHEVCPKSHTPVVNT